MVFAFCHVEIAVPGPVGTGCSSLAQKQSWNLKTRASDWSTLDMHASWWTSIRAALCPHLPPTELFRSFAHFACHRRLELLYSH
jgi:hypothetical protein